MVRVDVVKEKIRRLRATADGLRRSLGLAPDPSRWDRDALDLIAFRVYLIMQESVDLCSHVIADQGWGPVPGLRDHFSVLENKGVLPGQVAQPLGAGVKIRNLIGHAYAEIDPIKLHVAAGDLLSLVDPFCAAMLTFAEAHPSN